MVPDIVRIYEQGTLKKYNDSLIKYAKDNAIPLLDVYAMWEQMDKDEVDIHTR
jgi:hypothetical protein